MTPHQKRLLDFVTDYVVERGYSPSFAEIQQQLQLKSKSGVSRLVAALVEQGHLQQQPNRARSIVPAGHQSLRNVPTTLLVAELQRRECEHG